MAEFFLELTDLMGQRRLRHVRALGGPGEREALRQCDEIAKVPQFH